MPRAVFCVHALSLIMYNGGTAPKIQDLYGRVQFTEAEISTMQVSVQGRCSSKRGKLKVVLIVIRGEGIKSTY